MQSVHGSTLRVVNLPADTNHTSAARNAVRPRLAHVPRLSIAHFLMITTATAAVMALFSFANPRTELAWDDVLITTMMAMVFGWTLFGALLILWHLMRRTLWRLEPGEWLLLDVFGPVSGYILLWLASITVLDNERPWLNLAVVLCVVAWMVVPLVAGAIAQWRRPWWCALQSFFCFVTLLQPAYWFFGDAIVDGGYVSEVGAQVCVALLVYTPIALLVAGLINDWRRRDPRHWLHWSGAVLLTLTLLPVIVPVTYGWFIE